MSKLEQLINELCPDGVEYKTLGDVLKIKNGKDYKQFKEGNIPVYGSGGIMTYIDTFVLDKPSVLIPRKGSIDKLYYVENPFWTVDTIFYTEIYTDIVIPKFVFYYLQKEHLEQYNTAGGVPSLTQGVLNKISFPIPPLQVQEEIVRILDTFTELTAELTAELTMRKQQYEYYIKNLFIFDNSIELVKLSDIANIGTGSSNTNEQLEVGDYPFFVRSQEIRRKNEYEFDETAIITSGDGVGVGKIFHFVNGKYALHQRAYRINITNSNIIPKYFYYYMKNKFYEYITKSAYSSSVTSIRRPMLNNFCVPVPSVEEQQRIVDILDRFDTLVNDIKEGLPVEIEARKQQYEYYRDKLLTFKKLEK